MDEVMATITEQVADARRLLADVLDEASAMAGQPKPVGLDIAGGDEQLRAVLVGLEQVRNMLEATQAQAMVAIGDATTAPGTPPVSSSCPMSSASYWPAPR